MKCFNSVLSELVIFALCYLSQVLLCVGLLVCLSPGLCKSQLVVLAEEVANYLFPTVLSGIFNLRQLKIWKDLTESEHHYICKVKYCPKIGSNYRTRSKISYLAMIKKDFWGKTLDCLIRTKWFKSQCLRFSALQQYLLKQNGSNNW